LPDYTAEAPTEFKDQLSILADIYLDLKDAFVATDSLLASEEAEFLVTALGRVKKDLLEGDPLNYWNNQHNALLAHSRKIVALTDIEAQRKEFEFVSEALIHAVKVFGISKDTLYVQHCPMAFDDNGADWLSDAEEIRNPYFGDVMLKCGLVEETITN
jgi:Cu(I)/Ag(I) efflux system membrane fusion protein